MALLRSTFGSPGILVGGEAADLEIVSCCHSYVAAPTDDGKRSWRMSPI